MAHSNSVRNPWYFCSLCLSCGISSGHSCSVSSTTLWHIFQKFGVCVLSYESTFNVEITQELDYVDNFLPINCINRNFKRAGINMISDKAAAVVCLAFDI